jgi:hypothetical protein
MRSHRFLSCAAALAAGDAPDVIKVGRTSLC